MELMDIFSKIDTLVESSCRKNEKMYFEMCKELKKNPNLVLEVSTSRRGGSKKVSVEEYIQGFKWDSGRFQVDKSLKVLGAKIQGAQRASDERLKKLLDEQNDIKNHLNSLMKKESPSFLVKDLGDVIYESQISKTLFVNTHGSSMLTSVLVAVNKNKIEQFRG